MIEKESLKKLRDRYQRLKASVAALGLVQIGTVTQRMDRRPDASGRARERGPYYQWTFKAAAKTRTVNLTREQARLWSQAIRNQRKLEKTIAEMRSVSLRILEETTTGVPRRGSKRGKDAQALKSQSVSEKYLDKRGAGLSASEEAGIPGAAQAQPNRNPSAPAANAIPRRPYAPMSLCRPYVIASGAKQSPLPRDPGLLRSARNDTAHVFRTAAMLVQNVAIEGFAKKDARISRSKNKEMTDSSLEFFGH